MSTVKVNIVGDARNLNAASKSAQNSLAGIGKSALPVGGAFGKLGSGLMAAFSPQNLASGPMAAAAAIAAVGATAKEVFDALIESSKMFLDEAKGITRLDMALINNTDATNEQIMAIEGQIDSLSMLVAIQDDELRKSYTKLVQDTHDATKSMELLTLATDIHAGSEQSMEKITNALGKAYNGNTTALKKMFPDLKMNGDYIGQLKDKYAGLGETIGNLSPFERMTIAMDNIKEAIGQILAPALMAFGKWLTSEDFKVFLEHFTAYMFTAGQALYITIRSMVKQIEIAISMWRTLQAVATLGVSEILLAQQNKLLQNDPFVKFMQESKKRTLKELRKFNIGPIDFKDTQVNPKPLADRIKQAAEKIKSAGEQFKNSVQFSMGMSEDSKFFNAENFMNKMRQVVAAAKKLPAKLKELRAAGASPEVLQQVVAMGPEAGVAVAEGFLRTGSAKEYSQSLATLSTLGQQSAANYAGNASYTINVNKANMTADEIITAIQKYEKKTGRKVAFSG